jgi:uncharacterized protein (DUF2461 family)
VPRDHPRIALLRLTSITVERRLEPGAWVHTPELAERIAEVWTAAAPLVAWLDATLSGLPGGPPD